MRDVTAHTVEVLTRKGPRTASKPDKNKMRCRSGCPLPYPLMTRTLCYFCDQYRVGDEAVFVQECADPSVQYQPLGTSVGDLIAALASRGITMRLDDAGTLRASPVARVTKDVRAAIVRHKDALVARCIAAQPHAPEAWEPCMALSLATEFTDGLAAWSTWDWAAASDVATRLGARLDAAADDANMYELRGVVREANEEHLAAWAVEDSRRQHPRIDAA